MEDSVFLETAVAALMKSHVVEARIHTDSQNTLTVAQFARNREAQATIAGVKTNPYFVIVDPKTGEIVSKLALKGGFGAWPALWPKFIKSAAKKAGRKVS
jgi:hypothetical protein